MEAITLIENNTVIDTLENITTVQFNNNTPVIVDKEVVSFVSLSVIDTIVVENKQPDTVIIDGIPGKEGPPGISEEDIVYSKRIDFINDNLLYKGEAVVGSSESSNVWRIRKITIGADGDVTELWADGSANFAFIWINRENYNYS